MVRPASRPRLNRDSVVSNLTVNQRPLFGAFGGEKNLR
jgi:hypothetical protein